MNILLTAVNAKYIHSNLAVYSLRASAGPYEPLVELAEFTINHRSDDIFREVFQKQPNLLFLSCYIWNRTVLTELAENIRRVLPQTVIWIGGPEVSYDAEEFLRTYPQFDGVMTGEGERTFARLLAHYVDGAGALADIPGIVYREGCAELRRSGAAEEGVQSCCGAAEEGVQPCGEAAEESGQSCSVCGGTVWEWESRARARICSTGAAEPTRSLDAHPFVYREPDAFAHRIIYYESSRGCPYSCSYCLSSIDKHVRFRSTELVKQELGFLLEKRVPQVKFVDRTFNCSHAHAQEIWRFLQEHDNGVTNFHFEIAADILTEEELELLSGMRPGLVQLEIGVQTVNTQTLSAIHRTAKFEAIADRVRRISAGANIHQHLDLIAGLPYEDFESFQDSFDAVYALKPQELQLGFLKVLRGSEMHRRAKEYGILYRSAPPYEVLATRWISCGELMHLKEVEEMLEVYYNSQQFRCTIAALEAYFARPFALYDALAEFYRTHGYAADGASWSRMQRFAILREFVQETVRAADAEQMQAKEADAERMQTEEADAERIPSKEADAERIPSKAADAEQMQAAELRRFDELLTYDLYLRENAKSRPQWAEDQTSHFYKEAAVRFYRREEQTRAYLPAYEGMSWKQLMRMTHLERFSHHPENRAAGEQWLLFDYARRNPLTGDAAVYEVKPQDLEQ